MPYRRNIQPPSSGTKSTLSNYTALQFRTPYVSSAHKVLVGTPAGNRPLGRRIRRYENTIEINIKGIGCYYLDRVHLDAGGGQQLLL
jgi:hypothetical protein